MPAATSTIRATSRSAAAAPATPRWCRSASIPRWSPTATCWTCSSRSTIPTTRDRQGADVGPQYRSIVLYHSPEQKTAAEQAIANLGAKGVWHAPIVTEVVPLERFYPGEAYHQDYFEQNPRQSYCQMVIAPKVAKFRKEFLAKLKR
jgi:hypothetical protein